MHPLHIAIAPADYLRASGEVFAVFDQQDSGNLSYGVAIAGERWFVKTAGLPGDVRRLDHAGRVALLRNAVRVAATPHRALAPLRAVIESPHGPMLVYDWCAGELVGTPAARRGDPDSAFQRFRALPLATLCGALDTIFELHAELARAGWVASDFYDGCLLHDFATGELRVIDLDSYRDAPFANDMGRMFGSTRFMAPEEFELGARIDHATTAFALGRAGLVVLGEGRAFRGSPAQLAVLETASAPERERRHAGPEALLAAWRAASP